MGLDTIAFEKTLNSSLQIEVQLINDNFLLSMSSLEKQPLQLISLPDDLLLNCFARIPRLYYPNLSLVSRCFPSLLASPELYQTRSLLNRTENFLYVCIRFHGFTYNYQWFTLCRNPDQTLTNDITKKKKNKRYVLATVRVRHPHPMDFPGLVAVGSDIYHIEKSVSGLSTSSRVSVLDCTSHTSRDAPSLQGKPCELSASVVDRKIYVAGSYKDGDSLKKSFEVFDTKAQVWNPCNDTEVIDCDSREIRRDLIGQGNGVSMLPDSNCEIENVLYGAFHGKLRWYDTKLQEWRDLKGLEGLPYLSGSFDCVRLADYGGKLALLWEELDKALPDPFSDHFSRRNIIWCAVITLEKLKKSSDIFGKVEWCHSMLTVPEYCNLVKALAVTV